MRGPNPANVLVATETLPARANQTPWPQAPFLEQIKAERRLPESKGLTCFKSNLEMSLLHATLASPPSLGGWESVCKVKPEDRESENQAADIYLDSDVHVNAGYLLTDTIQHLLYAEAQSTQVDENGLKTASELGEDFLESLHLQLPQLS
jgi:hypothetical protein